MEIRQLETFVAIARLQSFTKAAEELHLTQPAVTRQIAGLEGELHTRLLERLGRKVELTQAGEALLGYASEILRLTDEAVRSVSERTLGTAGRLSVGANNTTATYILPSILQRFRMRYPGVELSVHTGVSSHVVEMVAANTVDLGIVAYFAPRQGITEMPLADYATGVVVPPHHPLAEAGCPVTAEQLHGQSLILMEQGTNLRSYVDSLLSAAGVAEQAALELDNVEAIKKMIEAGLGISLLPFISVEAEVAAGILCALPLANIPGAQRRLSAIYRRDKYLSAALKAFLQLLQQEVGSAETNAPTAT